MSEENNNKVYVAVENDVIYAAARDTLKNFINFLIDDLKDDEVSLEIYLIDPPLGTKFMNRKYSDLKQFTPNH